MTTKTLVQLKVERDELDAQIERLEDKDWPQDGDEAWRVDKHGNIESLYYEIRVEEHLHLKLSDELFRTEDEATRHRDKKRLLKEIKDWADFHDLDWKNGEQVKVIPVHDHSDTVWRKELRTLYQYSDWPVFRDNDQFVQAIKLFGERMTELLL